MVPRLMGEPEIDDLQVRQLVHDHGPALAGGDGFSSRLSSHVQYTPNIWKEERLADLMHHIHSLPYRSTSTRRAGVEFNCLADVLDRYMP